MISTDTPANVTDTNAKPHARTGSLLRQPRSVSLALAGVYLAVTGAVLAIGGHGGSVALHATAVVVSLWLITSRVRWAGPIGDLFPLFVMPILYAGLPTLIAVVGSRYRDAAVQGWEGAIFGTQPSHTLASMLPWQWLSELLHLGYLAYYPMIFAPALLLFMRGERRGVGEMVAALTVTYLVCWVTFITIPVEGPRYLWAAPIDVPDGPVRRLTLSLLAAGSSRGAAFPSSHMAIATAVTVMSYRWLPRHAAPYSVVTLLIGVGAVYGGFHYALDMVAGAILGGAVATGVVFSFSKGRSAPAVAE